VERANALERSLVDANYSEYCRQRADETADQHGRYVWYFIKANFELNPKEEMLNLLGTLSQSQITKNTKVSSFFEGYNKDDTDSKFSKFIKETEGNSQSDVDTLTTRISTLTHVSAISSMSYQFLKAALRTLSIPTYVHLALYISIR